MLKYRGKKLFTEFNFENKIYRLVVKRKGATAWMKWGAYVSQDVSRRYIIFFDQEIK